MEQLPLDFSKKTLENAVEIEFSKIMRVWDAFHYAEKHDPCPGIKYYGSYYLPSTVKETKSKLRQMYPFSSTNINKMTRKQAHKVYHVIMKYKHSQ